MLPRPTAFAFLTGFDWYWINSAPGAEVGPFGAGVGSLGAVQFGVRATTATRAARRYRCHPRAGSSERSAVDARRSRVRHHLWAPSRGRKDMAANSSAYRQRVRPATVGTKARSGEMLNAWSRNPLTHGDLGYGLGIRRSAVLQLPRRRCRRGAGKGRSASGLPGGDPGRSRLRVGVTRSGFWSR
jgi:hypothetical protein